MGTKAVFLVLHIFQSFIYADLHTFASSNTVISLSSWHCQNRPLKGIDRFFRPLKSLIADPENKIDLTVITRAEQTFYCLWNSTERLCYFITIAS